MNQRHRTSGLFHGGLVPLLALFAWFGVALGSAAAEVSVRAELSEDRVPLGKPVQLSVIVEGARSAAIPRNWAVDGMRINYAGESQQIQMHNFEFSITTTYRFLIEPQREGEFQIPSLTVEAGGQAFRTEPLKLTVDSSAAPPSGGQPPSGGRPPSPLGAPGTGSPREETVPLDKVAYLDLIVPQTEVYVGQVVPVEVRLYLDSRFQFDIQFMPTFSGEGFTAERLSEPNERRQVIDGIHYNVVTFYSAVSPIKTGPLSLGPVELNCNVLVPQQRGRSLFDDFFSGMGRERRPLELRSPEVELTAKALPQEGRPDDFTGAIGQFDISQRMSPNRGEVGQPLQMEIELSGRGNFSQITQPPLENLDGWRTYPGSERFSASDSVGFGGRKVFEITVMPTEVVTESPSVRFSYFDPAKAEYVILETEPSPVVIREGTTPAPTPPSTPAIAAQPEPSPEAEPESLELLAQFLPATNPGSGTFVPVPLRTEFAVANSAAALALLCLATAFVIRRHSEGSGAKLSKLRAEQTRRLLELTAFRGSDREFFAAARDAVSCAICLLRKDPAARGAPEQILDEPSVPEELREELRRIFQVNDELQFAGRSRDLPASERTSAIEALKKLHEIR